MASRDLHNGIQQMQQGQKDFGILNSIKSFHKISLSNPLVTQFDLFSLPVKLNINGHQEYQTFFGGLIHLILIIICAFLTIAIIFPYGIQLNSQITQTKLFIDYGDNGQNIFDHTDQPISFKGLLKQGNSFTPTLIKEYAEIYFYQTYPNDKFVQLQVSKTCSDQADFCIRKSPKNENAKIFGSGSDSLQKNTYLQYEIIWCDISDPLCPDPSDYAIQVSYSNFQKNKNGKITQYKIKTNLMIRRQQFSSKVLREIYNSNNYILGHIANLFHFDTYTYSFNKKTQIIWIDETKMRTTVDYTNREFVQVNLISKGETYLIKQTFDDISQTFLFFLSVKETFYMIIFFIFVQQYNKNSGYLQLADTLYYIDDPSTKKKFNFKKGYQVILVCWLHNHFISTILNLILNRFGKTINDYLPKKALCAISLIEKAQQLLQQNVFYGTLSNLTMMQSQGPKKVPLQIEDQYDQDHENQQIKIQYFKIMSSDNQTVKKQKSIKQQAFRQFCQANEYHCLKRKNQVYKVLTNTKLKYLLAHEMQLQFQGFIKNVRIQMSENIYEQLSQSGHQEIKIQIQPNEVSLSHNTSQIFIKK